MTRLLIQEIFKLIIRKPAYLVLLFGVIILSTACSELYAVLVIGYPVITSVDQLKENESASVKLESPIIDTGFSSESDTPDKTKKYYYFGQLGNSNIFLCKAGAQLEETDAVEMIGTVRKIYFYEDYRTFREGICENLDISYGEFDKQFTEYIIEVSDIGKNLEVKNVAFLLCILIVSVCMIIAGGIGVVKHRKLQKTAFPEPQEDFSGGAFSRPEAYNAFDFIKAYHVKGLNTREDTPCCIFLCSDRLVFEYYGQVQALEFNRVAQVLANETHMVIECKDRADDEYMSFDITGNIKAQDYFKAVDIMLKHYYAQQRS